MFLNIKITSYVSEFLFSFWVAGTMALFSLDSWRLCKGDEGTQVSSGSFEAV